MESFVFRDTNQDGLENFFGCVKSCSQANKQTPTQYRTGYGTMAINNITGTNSLRSNCEPDKSTAILTSIHEFISDYKTPSNNSSNSELSNIDDMDELNLIEREVMLDVDDVDKIIAFDPQFGKEELNFLEIEAFSHASSMISQKLMKSTSCDECKINLQLITENDMFCTNETIFVRNCNNVFRGLACIIPHICSEPSLKKKLVHHIRLIEMDLIGCLEHDFEMAHKMKQLCADHTIKTFCHKINSFLSGKAEVLPANHNLIEKLAYELKNKKKRIGKYTDIFNQH